MQEIEDLINALNPTRQYEMAILQLAGWRVHIFSDHLVRVSAPLPNRWAYNSYSLPKAVRTAWRRYCEINREGDHYGTK